MNKEIRESIRNDNFYTNKYRLNEQNNPFKDFEVNKVYKYNQAKLIKAIKYGMIINILYKGEEDTWKGGRERTIAPLVLGINTNTKNHLIRAYHLDGYSVSEKKDVEKVWRLFNKDNIISMSFTGNYIRMAPKNYKLNDRIMTEKTIQRADFNVIRRNQNNLVKKGSLELEAETDISSKKTIEKIQIQETNSHIDLVNPWNNDVLKNRKNEAQQIKVTILKSMIGNNFICLIGALGTINKSVVIYAFEYNEEKDYWEEVKKGTYKVIESFTADKFNEHKSVKGKTHMPIYTFKSKRK